MRVLYFSPRDCWPANTGARLRDFHLARNIAESAELTYVGFSPTGVSAARHRLEPLGGDVILVERKAGGYSAGNLARGVLGPLPVTVLSYSTPAMRDTLARLLREQRFDIIQMEGVHLFAYLELFRRLAPSATIIADWHNVESELIQRFAENVSSPLKRWYAMRTGHLLRRAENLLLAGVQGNVVCSSREKELLLERVPDACIEVIGNGVDTGHFGQIPALPNPDGKRDRIVFVGSMDYHANIDAATYFARSVWPLLHRAQPDLKYYIVGARPTAAVQALGSIPGIVVTGTVDEVAPYYASALAVVAPVRVASGTRLKILEALAAGVPVVSTVLGAEGLDVVADRDLLTADTPEDTVEAIRRLTVDQQLWLSLSRNGRESVRQYDWNFLGKRLARFYQARREATRA